MILIQFFFQTYRQTVTSVELRKILTTNHGFAFLALDKICFAHDRQPVPVANIVKFLVLNGKFSDDSKSELFLLAVLLIASSKRGKPTVELNDK